MPFCCSAQRAAVRWILMALIVGALAGASARAQIYEWGGSMGGSGNDDSRQVLVDADGNLFVLGKFNFTMDADPGPGTFWVDPIGVQNISLFKLDAFGNLLWVRAWGGTTLFTGSMALDPNGGVYLTGRFEGTVDFDPGPGTAELTVPDLGGFLLHLNADGEFLTVQDTIYFFHVLTVDPSGNVYGGVGRFLAKQDPAGVELWRRRTEGSGSLNHGGAGQPLAGIDGEGNLYVTGGLGRTVDFDPGPGVTELTSNGLGDVYVRKIDPDGNLVWVRSFGGAENDHFAALAVAPDGTVVLTGAFRGTVDLDPGPGTVSATASGTTDLFLMRLDPDGMLEWVHAIGGDGDDRGTGVALDGAGNVYVTGSFEQSVDFDPGIGEARLTSPSPQDSFTAKYAADGTFVWLAGFHGQNAQLGRSLTVDSLADVITVGKFTGTIDMDPGPGSMTLHRRGLDDIWVSKLAQDDADLDGASRPEDCDDNDPEVFPDAAENCENMIDDDCDGLIDDDDIADCGPLHVSLETFTAESIRRGVRVSWTTASEIDNVGFRVLRERAGARGKTLQVVGPSFIPARGSSLGGADYTILDNGKLPVGTTLRYYLEDLDLFGRATRHGPVTVVVGVP